MRIRAAHERRMQHAWKLKIRHVTASPREQPLGIRTAYGATDVRVGTIESAEWPGHGEASPVQAFSF